MGYFGWSLTPYNFAYLSASLPVRGGAFLIDFSDSSDTVSVSVLENAGLELVSQLENLESQFGSV